MASLTKDSRARSPYWIACYDGVGRDGKPTRLKKSTKTTDKKQAWVIALAYEQAAEAALAGTFTENQVRKVVSETLERITGNKVQDYTVRTWLNHWLDTERDTIELATFSKYQQTADLFLSHMGRRTEMRLEAVTSGDVLEFCERLQREGRKARTVNGIVCKVLRRPFSLAHRQGIIPLNPVAAVKPLREARTEKGTFTPDQVRALVDAAVGDWKGLILVAYFTGARLGDSVRLVWGNVDFTERTITFRQKKTGGSVKVPIHPQLEEYLLSRPSTDRTDKPVFPELFHKPGTGKSGLSMAFKRIMERASVEDGAGKRGQGVGRSVSKLSFHSLRHSFNSALANAGVPQEIRMRLTGHADVDSNTTYTHHELQTVRDAVAKIGRLPK